MISPFYVFVNSRFTLKQSTAASSDERRPGIPGRLPRWLRLEDRDDLMRTRVNDDDFIADHDVFVAMPLGVDHEDFPRQRVEADAVRNACSHTYRDVKLRRCHLVLS